MCVCVCMCLQLIKYQFKGYLHSVDWSAGLECWTGVLDWSAGLECWTGVLEWSHWNGVLESMRHDPMAVVVHNAS